MKTFEERAEAVLAFMYRGIHHAPEIKKLNGRWELNHLGQLSTFDFDELTRLVIAAHDQCVRATVCSSGPRMIKIMLHPRDGRDGNMCHRHPTMSDALTVDGRELEQ